MNKSYYDVLGVIFISIALVMVSKAAFATNGMNMEGYGPVATGMGGASMAYDNGAAAMMNNPATLGLMPEGDRLDAALGYLGPTTRRTYSLCTATGSKERRSSVLMAYNYQEAILSGRQGIASFF